MNYSILQPDIQEFINNNLDKNISELALSPPQFDVDWLEILNQIQAKTKSKHKLSTWFLTPIIYFPPKISIEQSSSEKTAAYKADIVSGQNLIDLSGGFGVDAFYFSKKIQEIVHCELDTKLSEIVAYNFMQMKLKNIKCFNYDSYDVLKKLDQQFDWIYVDPSRRNQDKGKVFLLQDCLPNIPTNLDFYFKYSQQILIKTAPFLDITAGLSELQNVKNIHIVAIDNDVKEVLWHIEKDYTGDICIKTINFEKEKNIVFDFIWNKKVSNTSYFLPQKYLYEPNAAIMKSGGFDQIMLQFEVFKLHKHSHLYTSNQAILFPGRSFIIEKCFDYSKQNMKKYLEKTQANLTTRNFVESVSNLRKKWRIIDGGSKYCFFTTDGNNKKTVLICKKIISDEIDIS